jgi:serine/threonine-protein kinase RsbW
MKTPPVVELTLPVLPDMELAATNTAEVVAKHMGLNEEKSAEISMALIEACINAFEHSESDKQIEIHFKIKDDQLEIQVTDKGKGFDKSKVKIPKIEEKIKSDYKRGWGLKLIQELMDTVEFESSEEDSSSNQEVLLGVVTSSDW